MRRLAYLGEELHWGDVSCFRDTRGQNNPSATAVPLSIKRGLGINQFKATLYPLKTNRRATDRDPGVWKGCLSFSTSIPYVQPKFRMQKPGLLNFSRSDSGLLTGSEVILGVQTPSAKVLYASVPWETISGSGLGWGKTKSMYLLYCINCQW